MKWKRVQVHIHLMDRIDELVKQGVHSSRQSAVNYIIRRQLEFFDYSKVIEETKIEIFDRLKQIEELIKNFQDRERDQ